MAKYAKGFVALAPFNLSYVIVVVGRFKAEAFCKVKEGVQTKYVIVKEKIASKLPKKAVAEEAAPAAEEVAEEALA